MVTKGIITSIDFNGNTCKVRMPYFEVAGGNKIVSEAIISNTPGSYNGYKVGDAVLVAFEDGHIETPVVIGKLYLGAAKESADPRGSMNVESASTSKSATLPSDTKLTTEISGMPNTNAPYASLSSIANKLSSLSVDVGQLDRFARNQFISIAEDIDAQGSEYSSMIEQNAREIAARVKKTDSSGNVRGLS